MKKLGDKPVAKVVEALNKVQKEILEGNWDDALQQSLGSLPEDLESRIKMARGDNVWGNSSITHTSRDPSSEEEEEASFQTQSRGRSPEWMGDFSPGIDRVSESFQTDKYFTEEEVAQNQRFKDIYAEKSNRAKEKSPEQGEKVRERVKQKNGGAIQEKDKGKEKEQVKITYTEKIKQKEPEIQNKEKEQSIQEKPMPKDQETDQARNDGKPPEDKVSSESVAKQGQWFLKVNF